MAGVSRRRPLRLQRAPRKPVVMPAGMMSEPPECSGDETSARGHRISLPASRRHRLTSFYEEREADNCTRIATIVNIIPVLGTIDLI